VVNARHVPPRTGATRAGTRISRRRSVRLSPGPRGRRARAAHPRVRGGRWAEALCRAAAAAGDRWALRWLAGAGL